MQCIIRLTMKNDYVEKIYNMTCYILTGESELQKHLTRLQYELDEKAKEIAKTSDENLETERYN